MSLFLSYYGLDYSYRIWQMPLSKTTYIYVINTTEQLRFECFVQGSSSIWSMDLKYKPSDQSSNILTTEQSLPLSFIYLFTFPTEFLA